MATAGSRRCSVTGTWPRSSARAREPVPASHGVPVTNAAGNLTLIYLTGLKDDYEHDGRVVTQILSHRNHALAAPGVASLGACYKQLNSSVGQFGNFTLQASTAAVESSTPGDAEYQTVNAALAGLNRVRDSSPCGSRANSRRPPSAISRSSARQARPPPARASSPPRGCWPSTSERRTRSRRRPDAMSGRRRVHAGRVSDNGPVESQPREVVILGSTGSIGTQALDIVRRNPGRFRVVALAAGGGQPDLLARQAAEFGVAAVAVASPAAAAEVQDALRHLSERSAPARHPAPADPAGPRLCPAPAGALRARTRSPRWPPGRATSCSTA